MGKVYVHKKHMKRQGVVTPPYALYVEPFL